MEHDFPDIEWTTSSHSMQSPIRKCVEVGVAPSGVWMRDSMNPEQGALPVGPGPLGVLLRTVSAA